jgi:hypothetical protein
MVIPQQAAQPLATLNLAGAATVFLSGVDQAVAQALVVAFAVVVLHERPTARRSIPSPKKIRRSVHSSRRLRKNRSWRAFRLGYRGGRRTDSVPATRRI